MRGRGMAHRLLRMMFFSLRSIDFFKNIVDFFLKTIDLKKSSVDFFLKTMFFMQKGRILHAGMRPSHAQRPWILYKKAG